MVWRRGGGERLSQSENLQGNIFAMKTCWLASERAYMSVYKREWEKDACLCEKTQVRHKCLWKDNYDDVQKSISSVLLIPKLLEKYIRNQYKQWFVYVSDSWSDNQWNFLLCAMTPFRFGQDLQKTRGWQWWEQLCKAVIGYENVISFIGHLVINQSGGQN